VPHVGTNAQGDRRLRVVPEIPVWRPTEQEAHELESLGGFVAPERTRTLEYRLADALRPGEEVLVQARTPQAGPKGDLPALVALTPQRLVIVDCSPTTRSIAAGSIASMELQHSLLGCAIAIAVPQTGADTPLEVIRIRFPSPLIVPFRALFTRLRLLAGSGPHIGW